MSVIDCENDATAVVVAVVMISYVVRESIARIFVVVFHRASTHPATVIGSHL